MLTATSSYMTNFERISRIRDIYVAGDGVRTTSDRRLSKLCLNIASINPLSHHGSIELYLCVKLNAHNTKKSWDYHMVPDHNGIVSVCLQNCGGTCMNFPRGSLLANGANSAINSINRNWQKYLFKCLIVKKQFDSRARPAHKCYQKK
jgi:hypothetical protein